MKRKFTFLIAAMALMIAIIVPGAEAWGQTVTLNYEGTGTFPYNSDWDSDGTVNTSLNHTTNGSQCVSFNVNGPKYITYKNALSSVTSISFWHNRTTNNTSNPTITVQGSTDDGTSWSDLGNVTPNISKNSWGESTINLSSAFSGKIRLVYTCGSTAVKYLDDITITYGSSVTAPTISPNGGNFHTQQEVTITAGDDAEEIWYTTNGSDPTASGVTPETYSAPFIITETTTVKAVAIDANSNASSITSATFTKLPLYTTIADLFNAATATETDVFVTMTDWVVTGVTTSNAYVTDGTNGLVIFKYNHGFTAGDKLNGTIQCPLVLYHAAAELKDITSTTTGLTVTPDATVTPNVTTISSLSAINTGLVVTLNALVYNSNDETFEDNADNTIKYKNTLSSVTLTDGATYNVTGVFGVYDTEKQIMPRDEDDVVLIQKVIAPTFSPAAGTYAGTQNVEITCATEEATIYYTTDGSTPTTSSSAYSSAIEVASDMTIKAFATKANYLDSDVAEAAYEIKPALNITYGEFTNGTVTGPTTAYEGQNIQLTVMPTVGYKLEALTVCKTGDESIIVSVSDDYKFTMPAYGVTVNATFVENTEVTFDFTKIDGFSEWTSSYTEHVVEYTEATVTFASANHSSTTITDQPVTKGNPVSIVMKGGATLVGATFVCTQWGSKAQTITLHYSADGGVNYTSTEITSGDFTISCNALPDGTNAVKITFSSTSNQVGIASATLTLAGSKHNISLATVEGGTIAADKTQASEGQIVTLTATPATGYALNAWDVYKTGESSTKVTVTDNQFTMPNYDVTVSATFAAGHTITYSVNGNTSSSQYIQGSEIALPTPTENVPSGFAFAGWTSDETASPIVLLESPYTVNADATLTAVFVKLESYTLTASDFNTSYDDAETEYTIGGKKFGVFRVLGQDGYIQFQYKAESNYYGYIYNKDAFVPNIESIVATQTGTKRSVNLKVGTTENPTEGTEIIASTTGMVDIYDLSGKSYSYFLLKNTCGNAVKYSSIVINVAGTGDYYTRVFLNETASSNITIAGPAIIPASSTLNMGSYTLTNTTAANLVIEDGGQLVVTKEGVKATVKKDIAAWTTDPVGNWYLISSPVGTVETEDVTNLESEPDGDNLTYDLYKYNEPAKAWFNAQGTEHSFSSLSNGEGYLYARKDAASLEFAGTITADEWVTIPLSYTEANEGMDGFNLVGNPYSHNISLDGNVSCVAEGYYKLTAAGQWEATEDGTIAPCEGFLVQVASVDESITFMNNSFAKGNRESHDIIAINVSNSKYSDVAYAKFCEGRGLTKISHRNTEIPMVYITKDNSKYAIAPMDANTDSFNVGFHAATTGYYTISTKINASIDYLHLIDNMKGEEIDMLLEDGYRFIGTPNDNPNRFTVKLHLNGIDENDDDNDNFVYQYDNSLVVNGEGTLQVIDMLGRIVINRNVNGETVSISGLTTGAYIVRLIGNNVKTQKIIVR